jgi:hypothetical protein
MGENSTNLVTLKVGKYFSSTSKKNALAFYNAALYLGSGKFIIRRIAG